MGQGLAGGQEGHGPGWPALYPFGLAQVRPCPRRRALWALRTQTVNSRSNFARPDCTPEFWIGLRTGDHRTPAAFWGPDPLALPDLRNTGQFGQNAL